VAVSINNPPVLIYKLAVEPINTPSGLTRTNEPEAPFKLLLVRLIPLPTVTPLLSIKTAALVTARPIELFVILTPDNPPEVPVTLLEALVLLTPNTIYSCVNSTTEPAPAAL